MYVFYIKAYIDLYASVIGAMSGQDMSVHEPKVTSSNSVKLRLMMCNPSEDLSDLVQYMIFQQVNVYIKIPLRYLGKTISTNSVYCSLSVSDGKKCVSKDHPCLTSRHGLSQV